MKMSKWFSFLCLICGGIFVSNAWLHFMTASPVVPGILFIGLFLALFFVKYERNPPTVPEVIATEVVTTVKKEGKVDDGADFYAYTGIIGEFAFIILPLIVVWMVGQILGWKWSRVIGSPEFSFGTAILIGQTLIKIVSMAAKGNAPHIYPITGLVSVLIVTGLVPSLIIMSFILATERPSVGLIISQLVLFILASFFFIGMGWAINSSEITDAIRDKELIQLIRDKGLISKQSAASESEAASKPEA